MEAVELCGGRGRRRSWRCCAGEPKCFAEDGADGEDVEDCLCCLVVGGCCPIGEAAVFVEAGVGGAAAKPRHTGVEVVRFGVVGEEVTCAGVAGKDDVALLDVGDDEALRDVDPCPGLVDGLEFRRVHCGLCVCGLCIG